MAPIVLWVLFAWLVAYGFGKYRTIGFWNTFLLSLLLSPLLGFIICMFSKTQYKKWQEQESQRQLNAIAIGNAVNRGVVPSGMDELEKAARLKESGAITEQEYQQMKEKIMKNM